MRAALILAAAAAVVAAPDVGAEPEPLRMDVIDYMVDKKMLFGKRVVVTNCRILATNQSWAFCTPASADATVGMIEIEAASLDRESFRRALRECAGHDVGDRCEAEVHATVGKTVIGSALTKAKIVWTKP